MLLCGTTKRINKALKNPDHMMARGRTQTLSSNRSSRRLIKAIQRKQNGIAREVDTRKWWF